MLLPPTDIPTVGRFAVLQDPQGAVLAVFSGDGEMPARGAMPAVGEFSWHELATTDPDAAWDFYSELCGWKKTESMDMGEIGAYQMFASGEQTTGGIFLKPPEMPGPSNWLCYARVDDLERAVKAVEKGGGKVVNGRWRCRAAITSSSSWTRRGRCSPCITAARPEGEVACDWTSIAISSTAVRFRG